jgi:hypothetical protein
MRVSVSEIDQPAVVARLDARFQEQVQQVPMLQRRATAEGVTRIRSREDMVPLLFPHTTYKSYPDALITHGRWDQLNRWLDSLSAHRVAGVDVEGVTDVDGWVDRLHAAGHLVSSSSGTSGKASFLNRTARDGETSLANLLDCFTGLGLVPEKSWHVLTVGPDTGISHHNAVRDLIIRSFSRPDAIPLPRVPAPAGHHRYLTGLGAMRRKIADGTARPDEIAEFEAQAAERQVANEAKLSTFADRILEHRDERIMFGATFPMLFRLCEMLEERGLRPGDITAGNAMTTGGGLKGAALPADYRQRIFRLLNIAPSRFLHYYSMQELNIRMPKCAEGRYHVPPHLDLFVLDKNGEALAQVSDGQAEGRAGFFDGTVDGRWGGSISGDKVLADLGRCPCGRPGTTVFDTVTRYSDLADDDKITCAGTMDAYVRGFLDD